MGLNALLASRVPAAGGVGFILGWRGRQSLRAAAACAGVGADCDRESHIPGRRMHGTLLPSSDLDLDFPVEYISTGRQFGPCRK
jgi:hypothetical protein